MTRMVRDINGNEYDADALDAEFLADLADATSATPSPEEVELLFARRLARHIQAVNVGKQTERATEGMTMTIFDKSRTLDELIAETCGDDPDPAFVYCDGGNGSGFGEAGRLLPYDDDARARYGAIVLFPTLPHLSDDRVECIYASTWIEGENGYRYQIRF